MVEQTKLATERDILRQAAKYFAGETNSRVSHFCWRCCQGPQVVATRR
jgi:hypothetical protein